MDIYSKSTRISEIAQSYDALETPVPTQIDSQCKALYFSNTNSATDIIVTMQCYIPGSSPTGSTYQQVTVVVPATSKGGAAYNGIVTPGILFLPLKVKEITTWGGTGSGFSVFKLY